MLPRHAATRMSPATDTGFGSSTAAPAPHRQRARYRLAALTLGAMTVLSGRTPSSALESPSVILSVVGTNDLHGRVFSTRGRGGLALLGGYVRNLRIARAADGGGVILLDAGDTFQGGIESNLSEGLLVVDAYNALGYTAAAIGNHEFDFGPLDDPGGSTTPPHDPRGALKALALHATFPFLAANLLADDTGRPVDWRNVRPSTTIEVAGITVGIIGVMTIDALRSTLSVNVGGLSVAPLAETIEAEARRLRARGATVVLVTAHAGGRCTRFEAPTDLSSCDPSEIFDVAERLPRGLVDAIVAGHTHAGVAHEVAGIPIVEASALGQTFSRVDLRVDRATKRVVGSRPFAPQDVCAYRATDAGDCLADESAGPRVEARYEERPVGVDPAIVRAMEPALARVRMRQAAPLGVVLASAIGREGDLESPLGNLFARAVRESTGNEVAITSNRFAGLRADLLAGPLTFGALYDVFPFDDRLIRLSVSGAQLRSILIADVRRGRRGSLAVAGIRVRSTCTARTLEVGLMRPTGADIEDDDRLTLATTDLLARSPLFAGLPGEARLSVPESAPMLREVVAAWLSRRGGPIGANEFFDPSTPQWLPYDPGVSRCASANGAIQTR